MIFFPAFGFGLGGGGALRFGVICTFLRADVTVKLRSRLSFLAVLRSGSECVASPTEWLAERFTPATASSAVAAVVLLGSGTRITGSLPRRSSSNSNSSSSSSGGTSSSTTAYGFTTPTCLREPLACRTGESCWPMLRSIIFVFGAPCGFTPMTEGTVACTTGAGKSGFSLEE